MVDEWILDSAKIAWQLAIMHSNSAFGGNVKVGGKTVLISDVLIVPERERVEFECTIRDGDTFDVVFEFVQSAVVDVSPDNAPGESKLTLDYTYKDEEKEISSMVVRFENFNKALGQSVREPFLLAYTEFDEPVTLLATVYKYPSVYKIEFQIMLGGRNE
ncbi:hypothetical protein [Pseudomonas sp. A-B-26]|uniref:hypothetical protein n=1 Tax=Pseudomonas sp. A-B-26 TaxID=2832406 RepID=UPI001CC1872A|nr:hypothetical protein [Pseudomonas sp. A-B-26]